MPPRRMEYRVTMTWNRKHRVNPALPLKPTMQLPIVCSPTRRVLLLTVFLKRIFASFDFDCLVFLIFVTIIMIFFISSLKWMLEDISSWNWSWSLVMRQKTRDKEKTEARFGLFVEHCDFQVKSFWKMFLK